MTDLEAVRRATEKISASTRRAIMNSLVIESPPPPLPSRDDPRYEAIAAWHLGQAWRTIGRHPDWSELRRLYI